MANSATATALDSVQQTDSASMDIAAYLAAQENKSLLRFLTCGSVDDGKSTLIGRLLYDTKLIFEDQLAALERDSARHGTNGEDIDFALLVDGLEAEREQGITIDVAYRFFATDKRKFIVADTPGHEQYTRNMATGASTADLAIVLVDARQGILTQTRRHSFIASLLGIRNIVLAVNKIDLVDFSQDVFERIVNDYRQIAATLGFESFTAIPLSARFGDNVTTRSERTAWYSGPTLLEHLETVPIGTDDLESPLRFPVQYVNRPDQNFRGFAGQLAAGQLRRGDRVAVAKSGIETSIERIVTMAADGTDLDLDSAQAGQSVTLVLRDQVDCSRGDMLVAPDRKPHLSDQFDAHIVWFSDAAMVPGRRYLLRTETDLTPVTVTTIRHRVDVNSFAEEEAETLELNEVALCALATQHPIALDVYSDNRQTGGFILIDRMTNATIAAGMVRAVGDGSTDVHWRATDVTQAERAFIKHQKPGVLWFTGLSGSGKSALANVLEKRLHALGLHTYTLDAANVRYNLSRDLGFTEADRAENIRRVASVARLMVDAGLLVIVSFISPFRSDRDLAREIIGTDSFLEIHVDTPLAELAQRQPDMAYRRALAGDLKNFTGQAAPYEAPENPDIHLRTGGRSLEALSREIEAAMKSHGFL
jgi:bifunctional enzyme CysN/CysC